MPYLLNVIYLVSFAVMAFLSVPFRVLRKDILHAFTRNLWGRVNLRLDERPVVWMHAVSVGEALACRALLDQLREKRPDCQFVLSTGTCDGMAVAQCEMADSPAFYAPFDFSWSVRRVFSTLRPMALLIAENDFWPNMLAEAHRRDVPLCIFNTRMSQRELREHRWNAWLLRPALKDTRWWGAVDKQDAHWIEHFFRVQPSNLEVTGSIKFDGIVRDRSDPQLEHMRQRFGLDADDRVIVAGSTHAPEEQILIDFFQKLSKEFPKLRMVICPRRCDRCPEIESILRARNIDYALESHISESSRRSSAVTMIDSIGSLRTIWGLAEIAFVGGSLARHGGQNMIEPASYGLPICFGPNIENFRSISDQLLAMGGAVQVRNAGELFDTVRHWLTSPEEADQVGRRAKHFVQMNSYALDRTVRGILSVLATESAIASSPRVAR